MPGLHREAEGGIGVTQARIHNLIFEGAGIFFVKSPFFIGENGLLKRPVLCAHYHHNCQELSSPIQ